MECLFPHVLHAAAAEAAGAEVDLALKIESRAMLCH